MSVRSALIVALCLAGATLAQTVPAGLGLPRDRYEQAWGGPGKPGESFLETEVLVWSFKGKGVMAPQYEVQVFFRGGRSVEERWIRLGQERWTKEELWKVLDGKTTGFKLLRSTSPLLAPYHILKAANSLISFVPPRGEMAAQLQNSIRGPQIRIVSREWAQAMVDMGLGSNASLAGRAGNNLESRQIPVWGNSTLDDLVANLRPQGTKGNVRTWLPRTGRGQLQITRLRTTTRLELTLPDAAASAPASRVLESMKGQGAYGIVPPLREALAESLRRFHGQANLAVPGLLAQPEWLARRLEGSFSDELLNDVATFGRLPGELALLDWTSPDQVVWNLSLVDNGWKLTVVWPQAKVP